MDAVVAPLPEADRNRGGSVAQFTLEPGSPYPIRLDLERVPPPGRQVKPNDAGVVIAGRKLVPEAQAPRERGQSAEAGAKGTRDPLAA